RPDGIDDWPHFLHDATNNAVAHDALVGPPQHVQWMAGPAHGRHHEHTSSISVVVSAGGRLFYVHDEGPTASMFLAAKWVLVARDAFNGVCLWKRPIAVWHPSLAGMGANPPWLPRTLVAIGDHLYAVLGLGQPISDLDAATGQTLRVFEATKAAEEILAADGRLYVVAAGTATPPAPPSKRVLALDPATGQTLWEKSDADTTAVRPLSLAVHGGRVFFLNRNVVLCLDAATGRERWRHALPVAKIPASLPATLVAYRDVVLCADRGPMSEGPMPIGELTALSAETGQRLWTRPCAEGWASPVDVFVADGLVWVGSARGRGWIVGADTKGEVDFTEGLDPLTGEVKRRLDTTAAFINRPHHHRCYRDKATDRFLLVGRHGVEFIPLQSGEPMLHDWIRGMCRYGVLPCNGLLYLPSHPCQCHVNMMLTGFCALASGRGFTVHGSGFKVDDERLDRGTAYAVAIQNPKSKIQNPEDWPTYRGDASRSGSTKAAVPTDLRPLWQADLGGKPTGVVVAEGRVLVANADTHAVLCLDANSGKMQWRYTAGGRVDSPPTIHEGRALFGSADGWVYCLRLSDGALVWRFRAAPDDLRTVVNDQLESVWPVHGSVLVKDGAAYFAAGRSSNLDGGIHVYRLDVRTGRILSQTCLNSRLPGAGKQQGLPDLMAADNEFAYMRFQSFPLNDMAAKLGGDAAGQPPTEAVRLVCPTGFLDDTWWQRGHWVFAPGNAVGNVMVAGTRSPAGHIMVFDDDAVYGYGRKPNYFMWTTAIEYRLFAADRRPKVIPLPLEVEQPKHPWLKHPERQFATRWSCEVPLHVRAMA
ncbi:MAG: hypothetical protein FJ272_11465, partial [Planctomycetes bacterium]|nr:hypothetical protein [Planctomycetota bacterium]